MISDQKILNHFIKNYPIDAARILENLPIGEITAFVTQIPVPQAVAVFTQLERYTAVKCLEVMDLDQAAAITEALPVEIAALLLRRMTTDLQAAILEKTAEDASDPLLRILQYPENTAAAIMDPLIFTLPEDITVKEALKRVRSRPEKAIYYLYIVRRDHTLAGVINITELMLAQGEAPLASVMHTRVVSLSAGMKLQAILNYTGWMEYHALPVVDNAGKFLGAVRYETLRQIEKDTDVVSSSQRIISTGNALGELYRIGLSGLFRGATMLNTVNKK